MAKVPVRPMRRLSLYFEIRDRLETIPLTQHISRNVSFRPQGPGYISCNTRCDELPGFSWEVDYPHFNEATWPGLAKRVPAFEAIRAKNRLGRALRPEQFRQQRHPGALDRRVREFPHCLGFFRPWVDADSGGRPRPPRAAAARPIPNAGPVAARLPAPPTNLMSPNLGPTITAMAPGDAERLKVGVQADLPADAARHITCAARANAVKGRMPK
jgi:hypothetical protein